MLLPIKGDMTMRFFPLSALALALSFAAPASAQVP